jgi:hypothetical protein
MQLAEKRCKHSCMIIYDNHSKKRHYETSQAHSNVTSAYCYNRLTLLFAVADAWGSVA